MTHKHRILFIDDSKFDISYIRMMLDIEQMPITPHFSESGIGALEYLEELPEEKFPHCIIVDINMPLMNGFEFVEEYEKKFSSIYPNTKLFISSSSIRLSEIEKAKSIGVVEDFIEKPLMAKHFETLIFPLIDR